VSCAPIFLLWLLQLHAPAPREPLLRVSVALPAPQVADHWFAEDKVRHFAMAFAATSFGHAGARALGADASAATALGAAATVAASVGKEVFDRRAGGIFSVRDLVWDAAGILLGIAMLENAR
jgi:uncharacterized protein YfiM (DUF2279 family)